MKFKKYHALGNDYIVLDPSECGEMFDADAPSPEEIRRICHRHFGIGSDGILWGPLPAENAEFALRIYNPDGGEAEKSGNGLRIFSRYLWDCGKVDERPFFLSTLGGLVSAQVYNDGREVKVEMGRVSFSSEDIPLTGPVREVLREKLEVLGEELEFSAATIGNPHCVIVVNKVCAETVKRLGPHLEVEPLFPQRTNVQLMEVVDRNNLRLEIWERGAGYTLASGSSSCASAAVAHRLGLCENSVSVHMPGGSLAIEIGEDYQMLMSGEVTRVAKGEFFQELLDFAS